MAERKIVQKLIARDMYSRELSRAQRLYRKTGSVIGTSIKAGVVAAAAGLAVLSVATYKAVKAANIQEDAEKTLTTALGYRSQALLDQARAIQQVTKFGDEQVIQAQALIASFVKDEEQIKGATKATLDLAAAKGFDLKNAADLVSKTLGSTTNALTRYGIEVKGAVGSTERYTSLVENINKVFGGQAAAQAETFGGKITQVSNAYGDLWEELGFVITRNEFFIKGLNIGKTILENMSRRVRENRLYLMELAKSGLLSVVDGVGKVVEVLKFFHNGWLGIKLVSNAAAIVMADTLRVVYEGLRLVLTPLDLIFDGLVKLGTIASNPFNKMEEALGNFQLFTRDLMADTLADIETVNTRYDRWGSRVEGLKTALEGIKVAQSAITEGADKVAGVSGLGGETDAERKVREKKFAALGAGPDVLAAGGPSEFGTEVAQMDLRLEQIANFHTQKIMLIQDAAERERAIMQAQAEYDAQLQQRRVAIATGVAGALASTAESLYKMMGSKSKSALKVVQGMAIIEAVIKGKTAAVSAWAAGMATGGPWAPVVAAAYTAASLAKTGALIASIGGSQGGDVGNTGTATSPSIGRTPQILTPAPEQAQQRPQIVFRVENMQLLDENSVDLLMERMSERVKDYDVVLTASETTA